MSISILHYESFALLWAVVLAAKQLTCAVPNQITFPNPNTQCHAAPIAVTLNGTYEGIHNVHHDQDFFHGIPYAQPPLEALRFRAPTAIQESWVGSQSAATYGPSCIGFGPDSNSMSLSEDCLTLNVIRPSFHPYLEGLLPVAVWIHGGGFFTGSSANDQYNLSGIVELSVEAGNPIIAVSINYRLSALGWLGGREARKNKVPANIGLLDQRLALHWIQENIHAFGGDPRKVTIWGESAGAQSVAYHLIAYGGRNDDLFRGAIMQSGSCLQRWPYWIKNTTSYTEELYHNLTIATGCSTVVRPFQCLQELPIKKLVEALNTTETWMPGTGLGPFIVEYDGDFIQEYPSSLIRDGQFVKVPIIYGTNTDEGTVNGQRKINNDVDFRTAIARGGPDDETVRVLETLYPNIDAIGIPKGFDSEDGSSFGMQWKRISAFYGDVSQHGPRRAFVKEFASRKVPVYSYRWDITPRRKGDPIGVTHFDEIQYLFQDIERSKKLIAGNGHNTEEHIKAADLIGRMWISFIHSGNPNDHGGKSTFGYWLFSANVT